MRVIDDEAALREGCNWLIRAEPRFGPVLEQCGLPPLRRVPDGFTALRDIVMGQVVSTASAQALIARLDAAGLRDAAAVRAAGPAGLAACGLSRQKAATLLAIADSEMNFSDLRMEADAEVEARLTALSGIGPWTAQIYMMTALGRADAFAPGDLAKQEAARMLFDLPARPTPRALSALAAAWSPWRGVAARLLWSYYLLRTNREGLA
jgi:DNA-3-methyladenine glycosylase II